MGEKMKNFFLKAVFFVLFTVSALFFIITQVIPPQYNTTYQSAVNDKFERLLNTPSPKIIFIGGSSGAFGINEDIISKKTNLPVANLALHAGFGIKFETELSKANIQKNDLVIVGYENGNWVYGSPFGSDLIETGIDNNIKLYRYIPKENFMDAVKYFPKYSLKKLDAFLFTPIQGGGVYQRASFENGNMIFDRPTCILPKPLTDFYGKMSFNKNNINSGIISYVNEFNKYVNNKGAKLLITFSPLLDEAVISSKGDADNFQKCLEEKLDAPIISNIDQYIFTRDYMYDTIYHCNNAGEKRRSELLSSDINKYLNQK